MSDWTLVKLRFRGGVWQGSLTPPPSGKAAPEIEVRLGDAVVEGVECAADGQGGWVLSVPIPPAALGDGVVTFLIVERASGVAVAGFAIATAEPADDDLRAEVALLRAELDMLKRHFRRLGRGE